MQGIKRLKLRDPEPMPITIQAPVENAINNKKKNVPLQKMYLKKKDTYLCN